MARAALCLAVLLLAGAVVTAAVAKPSTAAQTDRGRATTTVETRNPLVHCCKEGTAAKAGVLASAGLDHRKIGSDQSKEMKPVDDDDDDGRSDSHHDSDSNSHNNSDSDHDSDSNSHSSSDSDHDSDSNHDSDSDSDDGNSKNGMKKKKQHSAPIGKGGNV